MQRATIVSTWQNDGSITDRAVWKLAPTLAMNATVGLYFSWLGTVDLLERAKAGFVAIGLHN